MDRPTQHQEKELSKNTAAYRVIGIRNTHREQHSHDEGQLKKEISFHRSHVFGLVYSCDFCGNSLVIVNLIS
jgi:hypothetical protein